MMAKPPDAACFSVTKVNRAATFCPPYIGDWAEDNRRGREACLNLADYVKVTNDVPMVGLVLAQIYGSDAPESTGVRARFTFAMASLMAASR